MAFITTNPDIHKLTWGREGEMWSPDSFKLLGVATLEDVIEELIQEEIYDEFDHYTSVTNFVEIAENIRLPVVRTLDTKCSQSTQNPKTKAWENGARPSVRTKVARLSGQLADLQRKLLEDISSPVSERSRHLDVCSGREETSVLDLAETGEEISSRCQSPSHLVVMGRQQQQQPSMYKTDLEIKIIDKSADEENRPRWSYKGFKNIVGITAAKQQSGRRT